MKNDAKKGGILKWIVIVVVALCIIGAVVGGDDDKPRKVEPTSTEDAENSKGTDDFDSDSPEESDGDEETIFGLGETAELNNIQVTMTDYKESKGSEYNKPANGNKFILVEFEIVNNSDSELAISSMASFEAYVDDYALNYSLSALMEKDNATQLDGSIAAGKKMKGVIGYEVPKGWKELEIHFTDSVWASSKFKFRIEK